MAPTDSLPNEASCPIHLEILALLLRSDDRTKQALIAEIPGRQRARLAFFCYNRVHLRPLAFQVTALCDLADLRILAGTKGDLLYTQATEKGLFEDDEHGPRRVKGITLARSAHG